ncbi:MAG: hypothetical protein JSV26_08030 [bacterium]|nr:MAG: hypothetical protein JSV26_08030 [bacterium]
MDIGEIPIARCPSNEVEAYYYPFYIKKGVGMESDFLLLDIHLFHMTAEEKAVMGELIEINCIEDIEELEYHRDDRGTFIIGEMAASDTEFPER